MKTQKPKRQPGPRIYFTVTKEDIEKGERSNIRFCPVANSLLRTTGRNWSVGVRTVTRLWGITCEGILCKEAEEFIFDFDHRPRKRKKPFAGYLTVWGWKPRTKRVRN